MAKVTFSADSEKNTFFCLKELSLSQIPAFLDPSKCYVRALIDDDTYCTTFGTYHKNEGVLTWNDSLSVPLKQREINDTCVYVMVCINTESEISFIDTMLANVNPFI
jgi:hypothetical protein